MIPEYVAQAIRTVAEREGFVPGSYTVTTTPQQKLSHRQSPRVLHISVVGERVGLPAAQSSSLRLVYKTPKTLERCDRELCAYLHVLPSLAAQFKSSSCSFIHFPTFFGKCDRPCTENEDDQQPKHALLLGDVLHGSRKIANQPLDLAHARLALAELGKLHAGTFLLRQRQPNRLTHLRGLLASRTPAVLQNMQSNPQHWHGYYERARQTLNDDETGLQEEVEAVRDSCAERMLQCVVADSTQFDVLSHGDFWLPNLAFEYGRDAANSPDDSAPTGLSLLDWHAVQMVNPAVDIVHLMFSSVQSTVRQQYFWELVRAYHDALTSAIGFELISTDTVFDRTDAELMYPWETLQQHVHKYAQYGMLATPWLLHRQHGVVGVSSAFAGVEPEAYRQRMGDAVRDFIALEFEL